MFEEYYEPIQIWYKPTTSGYVDPTWILLKTIQGRIEQIMQSENYFNHQNFQQTTENLFTDLTNIQYLKPGYGILVPSDDEQRKIVGFPERYGHEIDGCCVLLSRMQWEV